MLPQGSRRTYCDEHRDLRKALRNRDNGTAWRRRQADKKLARPVTGIGRQTRTPGVTIDGKCVAELKCLMSDLVRAQVELRRRDHKPFPFMAELHAEIETIDRLVRAFWAVLPATEPDPPAGRP